MFLFKITDIKQFMNKLLLSNAFDQFLLSEAQILTASTFIIDGHINKDFYNDSDPTITIIAQKEEREVLPIPMLVRYILDNFNTAKQAIDYIRDYVTVYFTETMIYDWMFQSHFLIGDCAETYVVEFINS